MFEQQTNILEQHKVRRNFMFTLDGTFMFTPSVNTNYHATHMPNQYDHFVFNKTMVYNIGGKVTNKKKQKNKQWKQNKDKNKCFLSNT